MNLIYFEIEHGTLALDRSRITGCKENRLPSSYPTRTKALTPRSAPALVT